MSLIALLLFAFAVLFLEVDHANVETIKTQTIIRHQMEAQSAKEFTQFTKGVDSYVQSIGLPFPGTVFTVQSLQNVNLLPSDFPLQTPFGQTLVADYITDPTNAEALDVIIHTSGTMSVSALQRSGLTQEDMSRVQYKTASIAQNQIPSNIPGSTEQFFGLGYGSVLTNIGSSNTTILPSVSLQNQEVTEFLLSPGQYGYWLIGGSIYGWGGLWTEVINANGGSSRNNQPFIRNLGYIYPYIFNEGFSLTCPVVATNLGNLQNNSEISNDETLYSTYNNGNASQSPLFCVPAYKEQAENISANAYTQVIGTSASGYFMQFNGYQYTNFTNQQTISSNANYVSASSIVGLNNALYASGGIAAIYNPEPNYPDNEAFPMAMPNIITGLGVSLNVKTPQGSTDTYQIAIEGGSLFTGNGCSEFLVNPFTQRYSLYSVWGSGTGANQQNLCGSQENFWTDWLAEKDSSNTGSLPVSQNYYANGNDYTMNFNVATPPAN